VREEPEPAEGAVAGAAVAKATKDAGGDPFSMIGADDVWPAIVVAWFVDGGTVAAPLARGNGTARVLQKSMHLAQLANRQPRIGKGRYRAGVGEASHRRQSPVVVVGLGLVALGRRLRQPQP